jgi:hypothetical protein
MARNLLERCPTGSISKARGLYSAVHPSSCSTDDPVESSRRLPGRLAAGRATASKLHRHAREFFKRATVGTRPRDSQEGTLSQSSLPTFRENDLRLEEVPPTMTVVLVLVVFGAALAVTALYPLAGVSMLSCFAIGYGVVHLFVRMNRRHGANDRITSEEMKIG